MANQSEDKSSFLGCLWGLLFAAGMIVVCIILIPLIPFIQLVQITQNYLLARKLSRQGRTITWRKFIAKTHETPGSIVLEAGCKRETRFWWTTDKLLSLAPVNPPAFSELLFVSYSDDPFTRWCYENYLEPLKGKASLVWPVKADFETFPHAKDFNEQMKARFPNQDVIIVEFYNARFA